jgi:DNA-directed RNA polymerase I subunit RPA1
MQMSCLLGQQELEGKRPPMMPSGRTLPSFRPYEYSPRSGGFVDGSFLSGIRPQEYFFHCMAGREGLIDTAVKTARIGYLQRCLMKHLEGLVVNYDLTVRDSDGSVIQFQYGEDGLAVEKCTYLKEAYYPFLVANHSSILRKDEYSRIVDRCGSTKEKPIIKTLKKIRAWRQKTRELADDENNVDDSTRLKISDETKIRMTPFINYSRFFDLHTLTNSLESKDINEARSIMVQTWRDLSEDKREQYNHGVVKFYSPVTQNYLPASNLGAITERLDDLIRNYIGVHGKLDQTKMDKQTFEKMIHFKSLKSCIDPGESVGILAAQSIGEPSTQMTLNSKLFLNKYDGLNERSTNFGTNAFHTARS